MEEFLDNQQYTKRSIKRYEKIYGKGSVSTGGVEHAEKMIATLNLKEGEEVLDIGVGIGGQAFYMAEKFKVKILGIDFSKNMLDIAEERLRECDESVQRLVKYHKMDFTKEDLEPESFDVIHCRDVMMHVAEKELWIGKMLKCLKKGGRVAVSDYFRGDRENDDSFKRYVEDRKYSLVTLQAFGKIFHDTGFVNIVTVNGSIDYGNVLANEIEKLKENQKDYVAQFSMEEYEQMMESWSNKLKRNRSGDHQWGFVYAEKPF